jgi:hypothetical protein
MALSSSSASATAFAQDLAVEESCGGHDPQLGNSTEALPARPKAIRTGAGLGAIPTFAFK